MHRHLRDRRMPGVLLALGCGAIGALAAGCASAGRPAAATVHGGAEASPTSAPTTVSSPASPSPGTPSAECARNQLTIDVGQPFGVSSGTSYGDVVLTNVSRSTCWLEGSASVVPLDAQRRIVPVVLTGPVTPASRVTLAPGTSASEVLGYGSDGDPVPGQASCGPEEDYFEVTLPGAAEGVEVPGWHREKCDSDDIVTSNLVSGASARP